MLNQREHIDTSTQPTPLHTHTRTHARTHARTLVVLQNYLLKCLLELSSCLQAVQIQD